MKKLRLFFILSLVPLLSVIAQDIPNAGFENWTNGNPDGWMTNNIPGIAVPITQSNEGRSGSAAKLEILSFSGFPYPPALFAGDGGIGFPYTQRPGSLMGYYRFLPVNPGRDVLEIVVALYRGSFQEAIGGGAITINQRADNYTQFTVPIDYDPNNQNMPDTAYIAIVVSDTTNEFPSVGAVAFIDDLSFGGAVSVEGEAGMPEAFSLKPNFPNPFNPETIISYSVPVTSYIELKVFDALGKEVTTLVNKEQEPGNYFVKFNGSNLSSGIYFYTLRTEGFAGTGKMILAK